MIKFSAKSNKGLVRETNQDSFFASGDRPPVFIVCDGMGGHASGDIASRSAVESIKNYIYMHTSMDLDEFKAKKLLGGAIEYANRIVYTRSNSKEDYNGMGTTADICLIDFEMLYVGHVGDSRVYLFRNGVLKQITRDHTLVEELIKYGTITEEEAKVHPNRHMITKAVGTDENTKWDFHSEELLNDDIILMCSDGLTNMLSEEEIINTLISSEDMDKVTQDLINKANTNGGTDNITTIVVKIIKEVMDK